MVFLTGLAFLLQQAVAPRASAGRLGDDQERVGSALVPGSAGDGILFDRAVCVFLSFYTFGEDIKLLKECGIVVIMLLAAFQGIWSASSSISEEVEGRTALTVLSKPIQRRSYVLGKFLGIFWVVAMLFVILGTVELAMVAYKPIYEARENSLEMPTWQDCHREMAATVPGLALGLMQATLLSTFSVALATRLPQLANIAVCFVSLRDRQPGNTDCQRSLRRLPDRQIRGSIGSDDHAHSRALFDAGRHRCRSPIPMSLLSGTLVYCVLYMMLSMFLALLLFEDRDLA